jgi:acyl-[acyl-carrier-protein]-phospholipid O-acyltransferase/long-chain-fatty-acid--[acyl-carrier-protein] ligase
MVPHGTIEQRLVTAFEWDQAEGPVAVVIGIPDPSKGEALVLLTTKDVSAGEVRAKLLEAGFTNLWVPKLVFKVDAIPVMGSGKTDLKACRAMAIELAATQAEV